MTKMTYWFSLKMIAGALGLVVLLISSGWAIAEEGYQNIAGDQFVKMMDQKDFILINVHIPYAGEIAKTDLLIPFNAISQHKNQLPYDKDAKIVVYCMTGPMGYIAADKLVNMGYTRVVHFQGGMRAWKKTGKQLIYRLK
jgi:rhodanese-related sulfurtransferase